MKKKINICLGLGAALDITILSFCSFYLSKYVGAFMRFMESRPFNSIVDYQKRLSAGWKSYGSFIINNSLMIFFSLALLAVLVLVFIWVNKADISQLQQAGAASLKSKLGAFREKRRQKKIAKAKALLSEEEKITKNKDNQ